MAAFGKRWTRVEIDTLSKSDDLEELKLLLPGRTLGAIKKKLLETRTWSPDPWTEDDLLKFPQNRVVNKAILYELEEVLGRPRDQIWRQMKSQGYTWDANYTEEATDDNPYPDQGKKWTQEEINLFPIEKLVNQEILESVCQLIPRRKSSAIWAKMKKEGYIWQKEEKPTEAAQTFSSDEAYVLAVAQELGFSGKCKAQLQPLINITERREDIADQFDLTDDFTQGELLYSIVQRISPLPWEMNHIPEVAQAYKTGKGILEAAKALHKELEEFING